MKKNLLLLALLFVSILTFGQSSDKQQETNNKLSADNTIIFPNPVTNNIVTVKSTYAIQEFEMINILGHTVKQSTNDEPAYEISMGIDEIEKGVYLIKIVFVEQRSITRKILVK